MWTADRGLAMEEGRGVLETLTRHTKQPVRRSAMANRDNISAPTLRQLLHYDEASGVFTWLVKTANRMEVGGMAGCIGGPGYIYISVLGKKYLAHRLAWLYMTGEWPSHQVDHRNRDRTDNRWPNLRLATNGQNQCNAALRSDNKSGSKGVLWDKKRKAWRAYIGVDGTNKHIGYFSSREEAILARKLASGFRGEFADDTR